MDYEDLLRGLLSPEGVSRAAAPYGLLHVQGPEAAEFLHRMCSQDVAGMAVGEVRSAAFLDGKGKLLAVCQLLRDEDSVWLSTQQHLVEFLAEMLELFHFTEDLQISVPADFVAADVVGLAASAVVPAGHGDCDSTGLVRMAGSRDGVHWLRCHGPAAVVDAWLADQVPAVEGALQDCLRFLLREPCVGSDSEPNTLALEWPIDDHISTTKGCYTGQEIVARIHTYGHTNRSLCLLGVESDIPIEATAAIIEVEDGDPVGRVMSSAALPDRDTQLAFGFLPSDFTVTGTVLALAAQDGPRITVL
jgi:folate-binding protein YgfZ